MRRIHERRRPEFYRLRVYFDAIKQAKETTDAQWVDNWVRSANADTPYLSRADWIRYLERCAMTEMDNMLRNAA